MKGKIKGLDYCPPASVQLLPPCCSCLSGPNGSTATCVCVAGYQGNGTHCKGTTHSAQLDTARTNRPSSSKLAKSVGVLICWPFILAELDLCHWSNGGCSENAVCTKVSAGERTCTCREGYTGDGVVCLGMSSPGGLPYRVARMHQPPSGSAGSRAGIRVLHPLGCDSQWAFTLHTLRSPL